MGETGTGASVARDVPPDERAARLTRAVGRGDRVAFEAMYREWFDRVYRMARAATKRDEAFCLDVVQDVMVRVVKGMKALEGERELRAWMGKVTISCAIDRLRGERRRAVREGVVAGDGVDEGGFDAERVEWLRGELERMAPGDRELLTLRVVRGQTLETAGAAAGITGDAAHGRVRRVVEALRRSAKGMFS